MDLNSRQRDEFLKALEEAQRAAMAGDSEAMPPLRKRAAPAHARIEIRQAIDRMAGRLRSYVSASMSGGLLARLYSEGMQRQRPSEPAAEPPPIPPKSEHDQVVHELHLTPNLTASDLKLLRRKFAKANHPDRVAPAVREQATRRMSIANVLIDEALRGSKARAQ